MKPNYFLSKLIVLFFLLCVVIFITGCVQQTKNMKDSTYYLTLQTKEIKTEISHLENALKSEDNSLSRPTSLYYLALLYSHFKNPEPDYRHAFKNLEEYILLDPDGAEQKSSAQYLMSLLNKLKINELIVVTTSLFINMVIDCTSFSTPRMFNTLFILYANIVRLNSPFTPSKPRVRK